MNLTRQLMAAAWSNFDYLPGLEQTLSVFKENDSVVGSIQVGKEFSPTFMASYLGNQRALRFILSVGMNDIETTGLFSLSPLAAAGIRGSWRCTSLLLCKGASPLSVIPIPKRFCNDLTRWIRARCLWSPSMFQLALQGMYHPERLHEYPMSVQIAHAELEQKNLPEGVIGVILEFVFIDRDFCIFD